MKEIKGTFHVADCEHEGDMRNARDYINSISGCNVTNSYWDGRDCGEAYIEFKFSSSIFPMVYNKLLGNIVYYDDDIDNYIKAPTANGALSKALKVTFRDYAETCNEVKKDISVLLNGKIYISLLFDESDYGTEVVEYAISVLGKKTTSIRCYSSTLVDGCRTYNVLLLADINKVTKDAMLEIGGSDGWFKRHHIFGSIYLQTSLDGYVGGDDKYLRLRKMLELIRDKRNLLFRHGYYGKEIEVSYDDYMCENELKTHLTINDKVYGLLNDFIQFRHIGE